MNKSIAALATQSSAEMTMTSVEIAKLTGKEHKNVLRDIRDMFDELEIGRLKFEQSYLNEQNKPQPMFVLSQQ